MTLLNGQCHIEKIIVSLSLSNLFLPNSNLFPLNSNITEMQQSKNQFSYTDKRQTQEYIHKVCFFMYLTLPMNPLYRVCPQALFLSTKTQKHTFPAQKRYLFFFRCARSRGGLHIKKTQFLPTFRRFFPSKASPLEASCPILIFLNGSVADDGRVDTHRCPHP
jgi:hypothetical protein